MPSLLRESRRQGNHADRASGIPYESEFNTVGIIPFTSESDHNYIVGGAYERQFAHLGWSILLGTEIGLAGRRGSDHGAHSRPRHRQALDPTASGAGTPIRRK